MTTDVAFTFNQAVHTMGVTPEKLERLIAEGKVATIQATGRTLIPRESILEYFGTVSALLPRDKKKIAAAGKEAPVKAAAPAKTEAPATAEAPKAEEPAKAEAATEAPTTTPEAPAAEEPAKPEA